LGEDNPTWLDRVSLEAAGFFSTLALLSKVSVAGSGKEGGDQREFVVA
jgi:hypothetical protein